MEKLLAPNGKPSNLTPEQYKLVRTPAFKKWFGDWENDKKNSSKVLDRNGEPKVVYHGSAYGGINIFDINQSKRVSSGLKEYGNFFTDNKLVAETYRNLGRYTKENELERQQQEYKLNELLSSVKSNREYDLITKEIDKWYSRIYPVFLNLKKVKIFNGHQKTNKDGYYHLQVDAGYKIAYSNDAIEFLKEGKFGVKKVDGIIAKNIIDVSISKSMKGWKEYLGTSYLVFEPQNIKLADGTNTTFDSNNPDIRYKQGGKLKTYWYKGLFN